MEKHNHNLKGFSKNKIFFVTFFNFIITITEIIGGIISGSLALLSDAMHNFSDTLAILLTYIANKIARRPNNKNKTYGYKRAEILAAFINANVLLILSCFLIYEGINRFFNPIPIDGTLLIIIASIGLVMNLLSVLILKKDAKKNLNIKSSYLHLLSDTFSSVGVILGGIAIIIWQITWIDPIITILIALYIIKETWHIVKDTTNILMQSSPNLNLDQIKIEIEKINGVKNLHHIHFWMINEDDLYFEAHLDLENITLQEVDVILCEVEEYLKENYHISHVTLQPEYMRNDNKNIICVENKKGEK